MQDDMEKTLVAWLKNPSWRKYYEEAPSEKCREVIALEFLYSDGEEEEVLERMERLEEELEVEDWKYLYKYCGNNPRKKAIHDRIVKMEAGYTEG